MSGAKKEFLTFRLGNEEYAVEILRVQEIRGWEKTTPMPNVPSFVKGVVDLRGTVVPIIDLREKFHLDVTYDATTVVIVVHVLTAQGERVVGMVVDAVSDVHTLDMDELQPAPDVTTSVENQFILGLSRLQDDKVTESGGDDAKQQSKGRMVILIDLDKLATEGLIEKVVNEANLPMGNG